MKHLKTRHENKKRLSDLLLQLVSGLISISCFISGNAQNCPSNIDFESGSFDNWTCYTGYTSAVGDENAITLTQSGGPISAKHTMYTTGANSGELDPYGNFPVLCPNGSGHSIKLGSTAAGGEAEDSLIREVLGRAGAVLTTPGRAGTARRCGFGKRDGKEYTRNRRQSLSRPNRLQIWRIWAGSGADPSDRTVSGGELRGGKWMGR